MDSNFPIPARIAKGAIDMLGARGEAWLQQLPSLITACVERWSLTLDPPFAELSINYAAPGVRAGGMPVVLKVCIPGDEFATEAEALRLFDGRGANRLLDADLERGALLLERLRPGTPLNDVSDADDEQATHIAAGVMRQLWRPAPAPHPFPTVDRWVRHMAEVAPRLLPPGHPYPIAWVERALAVYEDLQRAPGEQVLLHGDLHHGNILAAERAPWLAIDPKGVVGEPVWETGPLLINQLPEPLSVPAARRALGRRARQLAEELGIDPQRLAAWGVVRAVLAGFWTIEDHTSPWDDMLIVAEALS